MGELAGWERANWFANEGQKAEYEYTWQRQNWFENRAAEHAAIRENIGMYDMSSFGKLRVEGPDACAFLNRSLRQTRSSLSRGGSSIRSSLIAAAVSRRT